MTCRMFSNKKITFINPSHIVTSTPNKENTTHQIQMEWCAQVERDPDTAFSTDNEYRGKTIMARMAQYKLMKRDKASKNSGIKAESIFDKICYVNPTLEHSKSQTILASYYSQSEMKICKTKPLVLMDSDEEELFWENRNRATKIKKISNNRNPTVSTGTKYPSGKTIVQAESTSENPNLRESEYSLENIPLAFLLNPKNKNERSQSALRIFKPNRKTKKKIDSAEDSDPLVGLKLVKKHLKVEAVGIDSKNITPRRSARKRCKPVEFWTNETTNMAKQDAPGSEDNSKKKKNVVLEIENIEEKQKIPESARSIASILMPERNIRIRRKEMISEDRSIVESKNTLSSEGKLGSYAINGKPRTEVARSVIDNNMKPVALSNFAKMDFVQKLLMEGDQNCILVPGLNAVMGIISSTIMQINPKVINHSRAPDLHHLIFCIMAGTITVMIHETSVRMESYGHFVVPCGVPYSIENIGKQKAILSYFEFACHTSQEN